MSIKILDDSLIQQIAAGEVVESPSSVVKELVENSIDAGSSKIFIELANGGIDLISVADDGIGMDEEDAKLSIKRHATSKIGKIDDLFDIHTLGFRGEALSSIASVSKFELITKTKESEMATKIECRGNNEPEISKASYNQGTMITIKDIFFNTPARKKHLKLQSTELNKVIDIISRYALSNPLIYFRVTHNNKVILNSPNTKSLINNIVDIYGKEIAKELLKIKYEDENYKIIGYISKPSVSRVDKNNVSVFVNRRFVKNKVINDALFDSYHTLLHNNRYPFAILMININPKKLDVNVHPAKTKIKIEQESKLYETIFDIVRKTLQEGNLIPETDVHLENTTKMVASNTAKKIEKDTTIENYDKELKKIIEKEKIENNQENSKINSEAIKNEFERKYNLELDKQSSLNDINNQADDATFSKGDVEEINYDQNKVTSSNRNKFDNSKTNNQNNNQEVFASESKSKYDDQKQVNELSEHNSIKKTSRDFIILGQMYKTYIICEGKDGLMMIDQHAAHERILFEKLLKDYSKDYKVNKQSLLSPIKIELNPKEAAMLENKSQIISSLGFDLEEFGKGTYLLRSVPVVIGKQQEDRILLDILDELINFNRSKSYDEIKKKIMSTVACRAAIKAGDELTNDRMYSLLDELFECDFASNCPHGRPTIIKIDISEIEKRFKRRGF